MNAQETAKLLAVIAAAFPSFTVTEATHAVWNVGLATITYEEANRALAGYIRSQHFPPAIADIYQGARNDGLAAIEAWGELHAAIRRYGVYNPTDGLAALSGRTRRVAECIGWRDACMSENVDTLRAHFIRAYEQLTDRDRREDAAGQLPEKSGPPRKIALIPSNRSADTSLKGAEGSET